MAPADPAGAGSRHCSEPVGLGKLAREKAAFQALSGFAPDASNGACVCILAASSGRPEMSGLEGMLRSIADRGYSPFLGARTRAPSSSACTTLAPRRVRERVRAGDPAGGLGRRRRRAAGGVEPEHAAAARRDAQGHASGQLIAGRRAAAMRCRQSHPRWWRETVREWAYIASLSCFGAPFLSALVDSNPSGAARRLWGLRRKSR